MVNHFRSRIGSHNPVYENLKPMTNKGCNMKFIILLIIIMCFIVPNLGISLSDNVLSCSFGELFHFSTTDAY
jgi:hypothetical protein